MDIAIILKDDLFQLNVENGDLQADQGLETAVIISLFTDRRVAAQDLPVGQLSQRGYWGDMFPEVPNDKWGSKLWTLEREKITDALLPKAEAYCNDALAWLITDGIAKDISVSASLDTSKRLILGITITKPNGDENKFGYLWDGLIVQGND